MRGSLKPEFAGKESVVATQKVLGSKPRGPCLPLGLPEQYALTHIYNPIIIKVTLDNCLLNDFRVKIR